MYSNSSSSLSSNLYIVVSAGGVGGILLIRLPLGKEGLGSSSSLLFSDFRCEEAEGDVDMRSTRFFGRIPNLAMRNVSAFL